MFEKFSFMQCIPKSFQPISLYTPASGAASVDWFTVVASAASETGLVTHLARPVTVAPVDKSLFACVDSGAPNSQNVPTKHAVSTKTDAIKNRLE